MTKLRLASDLTLPLDTVTQALAIIAKRRVGKSYLGRRIAEQLFKAGQQIVIADPKGDHWGIRSDADGKGPGLPVVILGGEHGDVPLESSAGEVVAKLVVEERVSALLDLSFFRKYEVATFMTAFLENLYRLKAREAYRTPLMLIIDEADAIAPQKPQKGEERMLGAAEDIVRRGGQRGLGCTLITQRTAVLNKNVLTQCQVLVALRTIAPQDLKAMDAWVEVHGSDEERETLKSSLPSLPIGDAWFWSPGWPTTEGIFKRVHVLPIETFDSGATPKSGEKRIEPKNLADVDLGALTRQMAATIEKAKADDPRELKKEVARLTAELRKAASAPATTKAAKPDTAAAAARVTVREQQQVITKLRRALEAAIKFIITVSTQNFDAAGIDKAELQRAIESAIGRATQLVDQRIEARAKLIDRLRESAQQMAKTLKSVLENEEITVAVEVTKNEPFTVAAPAPRRLTPSRPDRPATGTPNAGVTGVEQKILDTVAGLEALGVTEPDKATVGALCGYSNIRSKSFNNAMGSLRSAGRVDYPGEGLIALTDDGRAIAENALDVATLAELHQLWYGLLGGVAEKILTQLIDVYPAELSVDDVAAAAGYENARSKSFANMKGRLRTLGLIDYPSTGKMVATHMLFPEGLA